MTKKVRIENADNSNFRVLVEVYDERPDGDVLAFSKELRNPTDMTGDELYLTSTRYIKIKELPPL